MRKVIFIVLGVLALVIVGNVLYIWTRPPEPVYGGKPIGYWLDRQDHRLTGFYIGGSEPVYLPRLDSNAIPYLVRALDRRGVQDRWYSWLWEWSNTTLKKHLRQPSRVNPEMIRLGAARALGDVGTNSPAAIKGLLHVLKREETGFVRVGAVESLQKIGHGNPAVTRAIIDALKDKAPEVRDAASDALWQLDPDKAATILKK